MVVLSHLPGIGTRFGGGFIGVDIFFVLSGYLISGLLLHEWWKTGSISLPRFYMRRFLRLMPALWACVLVVLVVVWLRDAAALRPVLRYAMWAVLYLVHWITALGIQRHAWFFDHTWSLAVEEQFYLLWPALLCFVVGRGGARRVFQVALALALLSWAWRAALQEQGVPWNRVYRALDTRFDAPMWGCALAAWMHGRGKIVARGVQQWLRFAAAAALLVVLYVCCEARITLLKSTFWWGSVAVSWLAAFIIVDVTRNPRSWVRHIFCWPPLVWLGVISYGVYLWHFVAMNLAKWAQAPTLVVQMSTTVGGVALAALSFYVVERPFLRLKKRFEVR